MTNKTQKTQNNMDPKLQEIIENYQMGFTSAFEFLSAYADLLHSYGADQAFCTIWNDHDEELANFIIEMVKSIQRGDHNAKRLEDFKTRNIKETFTNENI
jgi:hypothetical protein